MQTDTDCNACLSVLDLKKRFLRRIFDPAQSSRFYIWTIAIDVQLISASNSSPACLDVFNGVLPIIPDIPFVKWYLKKSVRWTTEPVK